MTMNDRSEDLSRVAGAPRPLVAGTYSPMPRATKEGPPAWAPMPAGVKAPAGAQVMFVRFRAEWTATPSKGERSCICWPLTDHEEGIALMRCKGSSERAINELAKQMLRVVDGHVVDWSGEDSPGNVDEWWNEIGAKCRQLLVRMYTQMHVLDEAERADFFENCIELRTAG